MRLELLCRTRGLLIDAKSSLHSSRRGQWSQPVSPAVTALQRKRSSRKTGFWHLRSLVELIVLAEGGQGRA